MTNMDSLDDELGRVDFRNTEEVVTQLMKGRAKFLGYVRKRIADADFAEDVLQDCLLKALRAAPGMRDEEKVVAWFYRVLQNAITDSYRRQAVQTGRNMTYRREIDETPGSDEARTICACLNELVPMLKPEYAEVTRSIELDGQDPELVAKRLGITRNNLKVKAHRARQALRKLLEKTCRVCAVHHCLDCSCKE